MWQQVLEGASACSHSTNNKQMGIRLTLIEQQMRCQQLWAVIKPRQNCSSHLMTGND